MNNPSVRVKTNLVRRDIFMENKNNYNCPTSKENNQNQNKNKNEQNKNKQNEQNKNKQ